MITHPFRDRAPFLLITETSDVRALIMFRPFLHSSCSLILPPSRLVVCGHHLSPRIAIVFSLRGCTHFMDSLSLKTTDPSHTHNAGTEHVGFTPTRQTTRGPSQKRRGQSWASFCVCYYLAKHASVESLVTLVGTKRECPPPTEAMVSTLATPINSEKSRQTLSPYTAVGARPRLRGHSASGRRGSFYTDVFYKFWHT